MSLLADRASLAQAITLIESTRAEDREASKALLSGLWPQTGKALRIGITGAPGVGKSTFIDSLGLHILKQGHKLAVLTVDPSSVANSGAILGDKTRMSRLACQAFIRPSPGNRSGVALRTREAISLCEAAGYDVVIVETIGVGQSEIAVAGMTDIFVLLIAPGSGDYLQGIKRGIMELADLVLVNKCDGMLKAIAKNTHAEYSSALSSQRHRPDNPEPAILDISALEETGIAAVWDKTTALDTWRKEHGYHQQRRQAQMLEWVHDAITQGILERIQNAIPEDIQDKLFQGSLDPCTAANTILNSIYKHTS